MLKNVVVLLAVAILLFCSCKDSEQAGSKSAGDKKDGNKNYEFGF